MVHAVVTSGRIRVEDAGDGVSVLVFDRPDSKVNLLDRETLLELEARLESAADDRPRGLVVTSAKRDVFLAGADVRELMALSSKEEIEDAVALGQRVLSRLSALPFPTVAAIHGACLGGGLELALAASVRVASSSRRTRLGFPENLLGILPAWGGASRSVGLIGLPKALPLVLTSRNVSGRRARGLGLVDEVVPKEIILTAAKEWIARGAPRRTRHAFVNSRLSASFVAGRARKRVMATTRGHYPAPLRTIDVMAGGASVPLASALALERRAAVDLAETTACRSLFHVFLAREAARKLELDPAIEESDVGAAAVVGAGVMGAGIAQWITSKGIAAILSDVSPKALAGGMARAAKLYRDGVKHHAFDALDARDGMDRIRPAAKAVPLSRVDVVLEAAVEDLEIKRRIFSSLSERTDPTTILATNTSSISLANLAGSVKPPGRLVGLHFFNPVHRMELVEVVRGPKTSDETLARAVRFVQEIGKLPVVVVDSPGFLVNRVLFPYLGEALRLFSFGIGVTAIDKAMLDFGMPMGPLRLLDEVGLDVAAEVAKRMSKAFADRMPTSDGLLRMAEDGLLGCKAGEGFYLYSRRGKRPRVNPAVESYVQREAGSRPARAELAERMVVLLVAEAVRCLEEGVAKTASTVDLAMVIGTGFAPFRGGPLRYADSLGLDALLSRLSSRYEAGDARFEPPGLLRSMAAAGGMFFPPSE